MGDDIRIQGSRASGKAIDSPDTDLDIAIRVDEKRVDELIKQRFGNPNPGSAKEKTMLRSISDGRIQRGEIGERAFGKSLANEFKINEVQISVVKIGGKFDTGPWVIVN